MESKELPDGWTCCSIEDLASYVTSGSRDWSKYYSLGGAFFVRTENINTNRLSPLEEIAKVELPASAEGKRTIISKDDLLITITGANVGKCAHVESAIPEAYVSQSVALVRLLEPSLAGFIHKQLLSPSIGGNRTLLQESAYGIGRPVLSLSDVRQVKIYLAPSTNNAASPPSSTPPSPPSMPAANDLMEWRRSSSAFARRCWRRPPRGS